jgi:hypothetical protein
MPELSESPKEIAGALDHLDSGIAEGLNRIASALEDLMIFLRAQQDAPTPAKQQAPQQEPTPDQRTPVDPQPREDALLEIEEVLTAANRRGVQSVASKLEEWARSVDATTPETFQQDEHREQMKLMRDELKQSKYVPRGDVQ